MENQLYMAPMLDFTDCTFRENYFKHFSGIDRAVSPFIVVSENSFYKKKAIQSLLPTLHEAVPVEPQILGKDPHAFAALVNLLEDEGFKSVNINMGCPANAVVNKGRGCGFLPHPDRIDEFLNIALSKIRIPLSVKMRTGLESHNEIYPVIQILNSYPLSEVIIHPRLGVNKYAGPVDLEVMDDLAALLRIPVVYNGDVSRFTFYQLNKRFRNISRWMIGRELLRDPFLPQDIKKSVESPYDTLKGLNPIDNDRYIKIKAFHDDLLESFSLFIKREQALVGKMKSYWYYWESLFPRDKWEIENLKRILTLEEYKKSVHRIFNN